MHHKYTSLPQNNYNAICHCIHLDLTFNYGQLTQVSNQSIVREISFEYSLEDWCWRWNFNTLAIWCKEVTHLKRPWCWEWLKMGGEGDDRGWDSWMASLTRRTWVWVSSGSWWRTGKPGVLQSMGLQRGGHDWATELNTSH